MLPRTKFIVSYATVIILLTYSHSYAASKDVPMISLNNTDFVVAIAFIIFVLLLIFLKVPGKISSMLDVRALSIREEIDTANKILEDSKSVLADLEREHKTNIQKAERIVADAEEVAKKTISAAKQEVKELIENKIKIAEEQIKATEKTMIRDLKNRSVDLAIELSELEIEKLKNKEATEKMIANSLTELQRSLK